MSQQSSATRSDAITARSHVIDANRFGPWALVTGASAGIGAEFAKQLAAHGINLVLAARRIEQLDALGAQLSKQFGVACRSLQVDLGKGDALTTVEAATRDLDIGLVISNAGTGAPGSFLDADLDALRAIARVNVLAHLDLAHHFGQRLASRKRGGIVLVGAAGAARGVPFMAHTAATKAYVYSLGEGLHIELGKRGVSVMVLLPGPTDTPVLEEFGIEDPPMKPMSVSQCVLEALHALNADRASIVPGRLMRMMLAMVPSSVTRNMTAKMFEASIKSKALREASNGQ